MESQASYSLIPPYCMMAYTRFPFIVVNRKRKSHPTKVQAGWLVLPCSTQKSFDQNTALLPQQPLAGSSCLRKWPTLLPATYWKVLVPSIVFRKLFTPALLPICIK